jgi:integrase/recombinase XerD
VEKDLALIEQFLDALWLEKNLADNTLAPIDVTSPCWWSGWRTGNWGLKTQSDDLQGLLAERIEGGYKDQLRAPVKRHAAAVPASLP